jgi:acyl-CoA reductase-like NAD-dependent aldehyde dehydrogenase
MILGHNLIAGQWSAQGTETFFGVDPRTKAEGSVQFFNATNGEIDRAVRQAAETFKTMRLTTATARAAFLESAANEIENLGAELIETADSETGLGRPRLENERVGPRHNCAFSLVCCAKAPLSKLSSIRRSRTGHQRRAPIFAACCSH